MICYAQTTSKPSGGQPAVTTVCTCFVQQTKAVKISFMQRSSNTAFLGVNFTRLPVSHTRSYVLNFKAWAYLARGLKLPSDNLRIQDMLAVHGSCLRPSRLCSVWLMYPGDSHKITSLVKNVFTRLLFVSESLFLCKCNKPYLPFDSIS